MSEKTKNTKPNKVSKTRYQARRLGALGLTLGALYGIGEAGTVVAGHSHSSNEPEVIKPSPEVVDQLEGLSKKFSNVVSAVPDKKHPGLYKVSYRFTPGHNTFSNVYSAVAYDQDTTHATENLTTYNGGNEITHNGKTLTFDVETEHGFIVPNPDAPSASEEG